MTFSVSFLKDFFKLPSWYLLTDEEIVRFSDYILECEKDYSRACWYIKLDCSTCCQGCYFCDDIVDVCKDDRMRISRGQ